MSSSAMHIRLALSLLTSLLLAGQASAQLGPAETTDLPVQPAPRFADGIPNLGAVPGSKGFWGTGGEVFGTRGRSLPENLALEEVPFRPWARALYEQRQSNNAMYDPHALCLPPGGPRQFQTPNGFEFIQQPELERILIVYGGGPRSWRVIHTDGRPLPDVTDPDLIPTYMGYSTAHWEGDTLVIESNGYNEKFWISRSGIPHTTQLHMTERLSRPDFDTLKYEVLIDDPGAYTRPWSGGFTVNWTRDNWDGTPGGEIHEYLCQDNNRDADHLFFEE